MSKNTILQIGKNNTVNETSSEDFVEKTLSDCSFWISNLTLRTDNAKPLLIVNNVNEHLSTLSMTVIVICDILINELRVTSYKLLSWRVAFIARVASYELFLLQELRVTFCIQFTSYCLLHELRVTFYVRFTSYCLFHELRVTFITQVTSYYLLHELRVTFCIRFTSYCLLHELRVTIKKLWVKVTMSFNKDKDDKAGYDIKVMIKIYSLGSF